MPECQPIGSKVDCRYFKFFLSYDLTHHFVGATVNLPPLMESSVHSGNVEVFHLLHLILSGIGSAWDIVKFCLVNDVLF